MENFIMFFPRNSIGYKAGTAILQHRPIYIFGHQSFTGTTKGKRVVKFYTQVDYYSKS